MFPVRAKFLPWALMALHTVQGEDPFTDLLGIFIGHVYYYLKVVLPQTKGYHLLKTPKWVIEFVKAVELYNAGGPQAPNNWFTRQLQSLQAMLGIGGTYVGGGNRARNLERPNRNIPARDNLQQDGNGARFRAFAGQGHRLG